LSREERGIGDAVQRPRRAQSRRVVHWGNKTAAVRVAARCSSSKGDISMTDTLEYAATPTRRHTPYTFPEFYRPPLVYPDLPFHEMLARTVLRVPEYPAIYW